MTRTMEITRRRFFAYFTGLGLITTSFPHHLWVLVQQSENQESEAPPPRINIEMIRSAEKLAGLEFTDKEREMMLKDLEELLEQYEKIRTVHLDNSVPPALYFNPLPAGFRLPSDSSELKLRPEVGVKRPRNLEDAAFWPVTRLAGLIREGGVRSQELTEMYLDRLKRYDSILHCVISYTEERALKQAQRADKELKEGYDRGLLHGIPWGVKDLFAVRGTRTTWGAMPYKDQVIDLDATVVQKLDEAGAVLIAKLTLGALAWGDVWYGGKTRNPWNPEQGSSGSSAGSAAAVAAGCVGFAIGTETWGSIVSPSTRCGTTGLRPTFGRVSRYGAMALSWSMDKIGPITRSVDDCAAVFNAILGSDGKDLSVIDAPFSYDPELDVRSLKVGYVKSAFEAEREDKQWAQNDWQTLEVLKKIGVELVPIELPDLPVDALSFILSAEASAAFDELTRTNRDDLMVRQERFAWPNVFRYSRFIPAVEYIQANRIRTLLIQQMHDLFKKIDVYVCPTYGGNNLLLTNLTGHPSVVVPNGFNEKGTPTSITFIGQLFDEGVVLSLARAYQLATVHHLKHPPLDKFLKSIPK